MSMLIKFETNPLIEIDRREYFCTKLYKNNSMSLPTMTTIHIYSNIKITTSMYNITTAFHCIKLKALPNNTKLS